MKKIKILIVHNFYQLPGGEDTVVTNEKQMLEENGHEVVLYTRDNLELKKWFPIKKIFLPITMIFNFRTYLDIKKIIQEQHIDIVHVHNTLTIISPSVYYAALKCNLPVVQTIHNFRFICPGATLYRNGHICEDCLKKGLMCSIRHKCYRNSRIQTLACVLNMAFHRLTGIYGKINYICLTEFNKEKLTILKQIKAGRVFIKPNFAESTEKIIPYKDRLDQYIFVGRLERLKGLNILLETWKLLADTSSKLIICGIGPMEEWCLNYIHKYGLKTVQMVGNVNNTEVKKIMAISKALILPTQCYEGFPMTIAEAYSVGTPVIGSDLGNVQSLIKNEKTGLIFDHTNPLDIARCVRRMNQKQVELSDEDITRYSKAKNYNDLRRIYNLLCE